MAHSTVYQFVTEEEYAKEFYRIDETFFEAPTEISPLCDYYNEIDDSETREDRVYDLAHELNIKIESENSEDYYFVVTQEIVERANSWVIDKMKDTIHATEKARKYLDVKDPNKQEPWKVLEVLKQIKRSSWEDGLDRYYASENGYCDSMLTLASFLADKIGQKIFIVSLLDYHW